MKGFEWCEGLEFESSFHDMVLVMDILCNERYFILFMEVGQPSKLY